MSSIPIRIARLCVTDTSTVSRGVGRGVVPMMVAIPAGAWCAVFFEPDGSFNGLFDCWYDWGGVGLV